MNTKKQAEKDLTESARLFEVVVMAVADLGGAQRSIDTEDIAIRCHELAPTLFSWRKYRQQVNLEIVRVSLSDAKKQKNGQLLSGSGRDGWRLTRRGLEWLTQVAPTRKVSERGVLNKRTAGSIETVRAAREAARIEGMPAWTAWKDGQQIERSQARDVFRIDGYTNEELLEVKITRLLDLFQEGSEHRRFLNDACTALTHSETKNG